MSTLTVVVLSMIALALALVIATLATTWRLRLGVVKDEHWRFKAVLRALDGRGPPISISRKGRQKGRKPSGPKRQSSKAPAVRYGSGALGDILRLLRCIHLRSARLQARFGLADPAETGFLYGLLTPAIHAVPAAAPLEVDVEPVFDRTCLRGTASFDVSLRPIALVAPGLRLAWRLSRVGGSR